MIRDALQARADEVYYRVFGGDRTVGGFLTKVRPRSAARLDAALELSMAQARAGQFVDGDVVIRKLRAGR